MMNTNLLTNETAEHPYYLGYTEEELREKLKVSVEQWAEEASTITRMLITGNLFKQDGCYHFTRNGKTVPLENVTTTFAAYIHFMTNQEEHRKLQACYETEWSTLFILSLIQDEAVAWKHFEAAKAAKDRIEEEMFAMAHFSQGLDNFAICPFRTSMLFLRTLEKDMKSIQP